MKLFIETSKLIYRSDFGGYARIHRLLVQYDNMVQSTLHRRMLYLIHLRVQMRYYEL